VGRLIVDGFPRTGNVFLSSSLTLAYPQFKVDWGGHRIANFKKENLITSVRNPVDSIASWIIFFGLSLDKVDGLIDWYERFMVGTLKYFNNIYAVKFEDLTQDPLQILKGYSNKFNLVEPKIITADKVTSFTKKTHPLHLPRGNNNLVKEKVLESKYINNSLKTYQEVIQKIEGNPSD
jgi:hypothetical protein